MSYTQLKVPKTFALVVDQILDLIKKGELKIGDQLPPERELRQRLGVSRPSIREAFSALELLGVIQSKAGQGTFVTSTYYPAEIAMQLGSIKDESPFAILEARIAVETMTVTLAAKRANETEINHMEEILIPMKEQMEAKSYFEMELDRKFHIAIAKAAKNPVLFSITKLVLDLTSQRLWMLMRDESHRKPGLSPKYHKQHTEILEAISKRESTRAKDLMFHHLSDVMEDIFGEGTTWQVSKIARKD